jgi:hypothetical protein
MSRLVLALALVLAVAAHAADQPVTGKKLMVKRTPSKQMLLLSVRDTSFVLPAPGSADDPSLVGLGLRVFADVPDEAVELFVPPGPGWSVKTGTRPQWSWKNPAAPSGPSPIAKVKLVTGRSIDVKARSAGLSLSGAQGAVGVQVDMGDTRACALFEGAAVSRDTAGQFLGRNAPAPGPEACADDGPFPIPCQDSAPSCDGFCAGGAECGGILGSCVCVAPGQPCGDTEPVCNGECPAGEVCVDYGGVPLNTCRCLPAGSVGCGDAYPTCGEGNCLGGATCQPAFFPGPPALEGCRCTSGPPDPPCGNGCPSGWQCVQVVPNTPHTCVPPACNGGSGEPVCDGTCGGAPTCQNIQDVCVCIEPCTGGDPHPTCGGTCTTSGSVCAPLANGTCGCVDD